MMSVVEFQAAATKRDNSIAGRHTVRSRFVLMGVWFCFQDLR